MNSIILFLAVLSGAALLLSCADYETRFGPVPQDSQHRGVTIEEVDPDEGLIRR